MSSTFNESLFEKKLLQLRESHESISNLSSWCLAHQSHHVKIISIWLNVLRRVKIEHRLLLFYLANDVIQYSRRKHLPFVEAFAPALQKATTMVREDTVKNKVLRLFKIWDDRGIYDESFLLDLSGLLICDPKGGSRMDIQDFQPTVMYSRIRSCKKLEDDTDLKLKILNESVLPLTNVDQLRKTLKDREQGEDIMEDVDQALTKIKGYVDALEAEIKERSGLLDMLDTGEQYYEKDLREAKIVVNAYKCFGQRVKQVQKKLEDKMPSLPSPVPSPPDINAPSPSPPLSPEDEKSMSEFNASSFTMGESFINNTSVIEKALDSQNNFYNNEGGQDYYIPPVYNPSMTTGQPTTGQSPYTPSRNNTTLSQYNSADTSYNSQYSNNDNVYNNSLNNTDYEDSEDQYTPQNNQFNADSQLSTNSEQSYSAEYFIGPNSSDNTGYPGDDPEPKRGSTERRSDVNSSMFSSLMDSQGGLLPPPPPPPPPKSPSTSKEKSDENKIEVIMGNAKQPTLSEIIQSLMAKKDMKLELPVPLEPPPMPPSGLQEEDNWEPDEWESPLSPPPFQDFPAADTDMRPKDIDHRNLISLTGWDSKTPEDSMDKDERRIRSSFLDSDSSDSRSPPDHIPPLNLPPPNIPPPNLVPNHPPPTNLHPPTNLPPPSNLPPNTNLPPPNLPQLSKLPPPTNLPPNKLLPPLNLPPPTNLPPPNNMHHPITLNIPPHLLPPPDFEEHKISPLLPNHPQHNMDNVENIDMEMSDEEDRREISPMNTRTRPGLVTITPEPDDHGPPTGIPSSPLPINHTLPPPPSPNMALLNPFPGTPRMTMLNAPPKMDSPCGPRPPPRMMGPNTPEPWLRPPTFTPHQSPSRPPHLMMHSPRPPFFRQGPRPFRPRHFRPRFQPRW